MEMKVKAHVTMYGNQIYYLRENLIFKVSHNCAISIHESYYNNAMSVIGVYNLSANDRELLVDLCAMMVELYPKGTEEADWKQKMLTDNVIFIKRDSQTVAFDYERHLIQWERLPLTPTRLNCKLAIKIMGFILSKKFDGKAVPLIHVHQIWIRPQEMPQICFDEEEDDDEHASEPMDNDDSGTGTDLPETQEYLLYQNSQFM